MINDFLINYNLFAFEHRFLFRLLTFTNNIYSNPSSQTTLKNCFRVRAERQRNRFLRNNRELDTIRTRTHFGDMTFGCFFPKLINLISLSTIHLSAQEFRTKIKNNINFIFNSISVVTDKLPDKFYTFKNFFLYNYYSNLKF